MNSLRVQQIKAEGNTPSKQLNNSSETFTAYGQSFVSVLPKSILASKELSPVDKIVYSGLLDFCGTKDHCWPRRSILAAAVGLSEHQVTRSLNRLVKLKFIRRVQAGDGKAAITEILFHPSLFGSLKPDSAYAKLQHLNGDQPTQICTSAIANLQRTACANLQQPIKEEEVQFEEVQEVSTTTKAKLPILNEKQPEQPKAWWSSEQLSEARRLLEFHSTNRQLGKPDSTIAGRILSNLEDWSDFELYLRLRRQSPGPYAKSWAFYEKDVKHYWPQRRKDCLLDQDTADRKELERTARMEQEDAERKERIATESRAELRSGILTEHPETSGMSEEEFDKWLERYTQQQIAEFDAMSKAKAEKRTAQSEEDLRRKTEQFDRVQASIIESQQRKKQAKQGFLPNPTGLQHASVCVSQMGAA